jgi:hypothetical protein
VAERKDRCEIDLTQKVQVGSMTRKIINSLLNVTLQIYVEQGTQPHIAIISRAHAKANKRGIFFFMPFTFVFALVCEFPKSTAVVQSQGDGERSDFGADFPSTPSEINSMCGRNHRERFDFGTFSWSLLLVSKEVTGHQAKAILSMGPACKDLLILN